jgi:2-oxo-4-hydroxy-4-carboxy-5-ureidoimidazoline decarboxylase
MANVSPQASATLGSFNAAPAQDAERTALACCASRTFAKAVADGRPYPDLAALLAAVDTAFKGLNWDDIVEAMNEHPRIGDRAVRSGMSAAEQSGAATRSGRDWRTATWPTSSASAISS